MYQYVERSSQDTQDGFDLYRAQASFVWLCIKLARPFKGSFGLYHSTIMLKSESTWNQKCTECCEPAICLFSKRDISIHNIQRYFWKIQDGGCRHVHFVDLLQTLVLHTNSSTFKVYLIAQIHKSRMYGT